MRDNRYVYARMPSVYLVQLASGPCKIGSTNVRLKYRAQQIGRATGEEAALLGYTRLCCYTMRMAYERWLQKRYAAKRAEMPRKREWFVFDRANIDEILSLPGWIITGTESDEPRGVDWRHGRRWGMSQVSDGKAARVCPLCSASIIEWLNRWIQADFTQSLRETP